jgi:hypothetical protein
MTDDLAALPYTPEELDTLRRQSETDIADPDLTYITEVRRLLVTVAALSRPAPAPSLDVERLMVAVFNADQPGDWPTWDEYIAAFGSAGTPPWRRKAQRIATGYARLSAEEPQQKGQDQ